MNYYIDEMGMEIPKKIFLLQWKLLRFCLWKELMLSKSLLKPIPGSIIIFLHIRLFQMLKCGNKKRFICKCFEKIFNSKAGDIIDKWLMNVTDKRWKKKTQPGKLNDHGVKVGMMVNRHFSKPDPKNFQAKVVQQYENKVKNLLAIEDSTSYNDHFCEL